MPPRGGVRPGAGRPSGGTFVESAPRVLLEDVGAHAGPTTAATAGPAALRRIVFTRPRVDPRAQAYCERRTQEGETRRGIVRCLERYAAREVCGRVGRIPAPLRYRDVRQT